MGDRARPRVASRPARRASTRSARGYEPVITRSAHFIPNPGFRDAVAEFLDSERAAVAAEIEWLRRDLPYRSSSSE